MRGHSAQSSLPLILPAPDTVNVYGFGSGLRSSPCLSHCTEYSPRGHKSAHFTHVPCSIAARPSFVGSTPQLTLTWDAAHFWQFTQTPSGLLLVGGLPWQPSRYSFEGHGGHSGASNGCSHNVQEGGGCPGAGAGGVHAGGATFASVSLPFQCNVWDL